MKVRALELKCFFSKRDRVHSNIGFENARHRNCWGAIVQQGNICRGYSARTGQCGGETNGRHGLNEGSQRNDGAQAFFLPHTVKNKHREPFPLLDFQHFFRQ